MIVASIARLLLLLLLGTAFGPAAPMWRRGEPAPSTGPEAR
jgi:hypothetical protein